jgi:hypothetical protein
MTVASASAESILSYEDVSAPVVGGRDKRAPYQFRTKSVFCQDPFEKKPPFSVANACRSSRFWQYSSLSILHIALDFSGKRGIIVV